MTAHAVESESTLMSLATYIVDKMRVTRPSGKTAERNPDRVYTVHGTFWSTDTDPKGKLIRKDKLSIVSKNVDYADVMAEGFAVNLSAGTLTLPEGKRGRTASASLSESDILAELAAIRGELSDDDEPENAPAE